MAVRSLHVTEIRLLATIVFFYFPLKISGLIEPPSAVTVMAVDGSDFVIITWNYQANVTSYRILFRNLKSSSAPDEAGPMTTYCLSDNTTCSYCISNINRGVSCTTLNRHYTVSSGSELDFEQPVSVRVDACDDFHPEACVHQSEWRNYTIPSGAPSPVRNVHAWPLSSNTVEVTWSTPNQTRGTIVLYSVLYKTEKSREMKRVFKSGSKGILTRLTAKTKYTIWVTASTADKEGERSHLTTVETYADECVSSPCKYNSKCHVDGSSFTCDCTGLWDGRTCNNPKGFALEKNKCLSMEDHKNLSIHANVSLEFCAAKCRGISSCKSFEYGLGYSSEGRFISTLHQGLGHCKLQSTGTVHHKLKPCYYDYYEKKPPVSAVSAVSFPNMVFFGTFVFLHLIHMMPPC